MRALLSLLLVLNAVHGAVDLDRTVKLLREGERLSASGAAELESRISKRPNDLENRLRLLSYYAGQSAWGDIASVRTARARHVLWLIEHEPKAAIFTYATRIHTIQPAGGPLADPAGFQAAKDAWQRQVAGNPKDASLKRNAAEFLEIHDPAAAEALLQATGDARWLGQIYAKAVLGIDAMEYRTNEPASTSGEKRNSAFAKHALAQLEQSNNSVVLGGAGFTLCRDGGALYADGKLDWDYTPLARNFLEKAGQLDPSNADAFSVVPELPKRGERPPMTIRVGGAVQAQNIKKQVKPIPPPGLQSTGAVVRVQVLIGLDGKVVRAMAVSGPAQLRDASTEAIKQWVYTPTLLNGKPVYVLSAVDFQF